MKTDSFEAGALKEIYEKRFSFTHDYRFKVWSVLVPNFFQKWIAEDAVVMDLGCGYGEFINQVRAGTKYGLDLNPEAGNRLYSEVTWLQKKSTDDWGITPGSVDVVFTSNFFEHLRTKEDLDLTIDRVRQYLKPGGMLIALGPNMNRLNGTYWDFWDHHLALSEKSLSELLQMKNFTVEKQLRSFLPYTMVGGREYPLSFVRAYLMLPWCWNFFGKQFLVVARKKKSDTALVCAGL